MPDLTIQLVQDTLIMDKATLSLLGIIDTLTHELRTEKTLSTPEGACLIEPLNNLRQELLEEGVRHTKRLGAARDQISSLLDQFGQQAVSDRDLQWVLNSIQLTWTLGTEPPGLPPRSSSGPKIAPPAPAPAKPKQVVGKHRNGVTRA